MEPKYWQDAFESLGQALSRLKKALASPIDENRFIIDATIQRFEFSIELLWKVLKKALELEGKETNSPREALQQAYIMKWINDETFWLNMLKNRNLTSHTYKEKTADEVYQNIKIYYPEMQSLHDFIKEKFFKI